MDTTAAYIIDDGARRRLALQLEEALEETEVWLDSELALAKSNVASYMEDGVWGQLMELEPVKAEKAPEARMQGQRKTADDEC